MVVLSVQQLQRLMTGGTMVVRPSVEWHGVPERRRLVVDQLELPPSPNAWTSDTARKAGSTVTSVALRNNFPSTNSELSLGLPAKRFLTR